MSQRTTDIIDDSRKYLVMGRVLFPRELVNLVVALVGRTPMLQEVLGPCEDDFRCIKIFLLKRFVTLNGVGASRPQNCTPLLYIKTEYYAMITVPTHNRHKRALKHSKTIDVFTSGAVIVNVQIHSSKKVLKG